MTGTLVSTYVTGGRERRAARAKVRECLAETENTRWLDADYQEFRKALIRLDSAAIIARFDRALIHRYTYLAEVAHYAEIVQKGETDWLPPRTLPIELATLLESVVVMIANEAWRPRFWRAVVALRAGVPSRRRRWHHQASRHLASAWSHSVIGLRHQCVH